jgi:hypothetical protein
MQTRTGRAARRRLALVALTSLWLGACGGGGGGDIPTGSALTPAAGTPPSALGGGSAAPAPAPAPAAVSVFQSGDLWLTTSHAGEVQRYQRMARHPDGTYVMHYQRIARLTDGSYVGVRDSYLPGQTSGEKVVLTGRLDADGNPIGGETTIAPGSSPGVTAFSDGTFLVTWLEPRSSTSPTFTFLVGVRGQRYDAAGVPVGGQLSLGLAGASAQPTALADGTFVLATFGQNSKVNGPAGFLAGYTQDGIETGFRAGLSVDSCGIAGSPSVAALPSGGFAVAWGYQCASAPQVRMRVYDGSGALAASSQMTVGVAGQGVLNPGLASLTSGDVALAWGLVDPTGVVEVRTQVVDPTALPDSPVGARTVPLQTGRTPGPVQSLAGGGFVIPWSAVNDGEAQVPVNHYSNAGEPLQ